MIEYYYHRLENVVGNVFEAVIEVEDGVPTCSYSTQHGFATFEKHQIHLITSQLQFHERVEASFAKERISEIKAIKNIV